jgi:putative glutamine amidotransferase
VKRPLIGVSLGDGGRPGRHSLREDYVRSLEQAGALPVLLPPVRPGDAPALVARLDGLLLSGGADVDPALYGQPPSAKLGRVERSRDEFELALVRESLARDLPLLAICRGQQVLNVATGGTLLQDIPSELEGAGEHDAPGPRWQVAHEVQLVPHTRLRSILGRDTVAVNSFHHQAVDRPGEGVQVVGRCPEDGVIEAVEIPSRRFVVAVQWHPESFWKRRASFQALFDAHAEACRS